MRDDLQWAHTRQPSAVGRNDDGPNPSNVFGWGAGQSRGDNSFSTINGGCV